MSVFSCMGIDPKGPLMGDPQYCMSILKGTKRQQSGKMGQNIQNCSSLRNITSQAN